MSIYYQPDVRADFESGMEAIADCFPPTADTKCPHCGLVVRRPIIVKESDRRAFEEMITSAQKVLDRNNVTGLVLAELFAEITVNKARKQAGAE
jgi:hypothetical protein